MKNFFVWLFFVITIISSGMNFYLLNESSDCDACDMRFDRDSGNAINGLYSNPKYFCVWVKDRTPSDIAETTFHELAHYYAYSNPEHFNVEVKE